MGAFERRLEELVAETRRDPSREELRAELEGWIAAHPLEFRASIPPEVLSFGVSPDRLERRLRFLKHLLLNGYAPPRVEDDDGTRWGQDTVNFGVVTGYFYGNCLSFLEAGLTRSDVAVCVAYPSSDRQQPWLETAPTQVGAGVQLRAALMLDDDGLVFRRFRRPVPIHYLFPVDNYYRSKFELVGQYAGSGVPMPGSTLIREVCENKLLLGEIAGGIPGLRLAPELPRVRGDDAAAWAERLDHFCTEHVIRALVTKPVDAFGGAGVQFWRYPEQCGALLDHLAEAMQERTAMLVQQRIVPVPTTSGRDWNLRQYVVRESGDTVLSRWKRIRAGHGVINTTQGAHSLTLQQLLEDLPLTGAAREAFERALAMTDRLAGDVLRALERYLQRRFGGERQPYRGSGSNLEPDLLALDFMISEAAGRPGHYVVYLNEINDFASGGMRDYEILAHRAAFPDAERIVAAHPFSLAPHVLDLAKWRGQAYKEAIAHAGFPWTHPR